MIFRPGRYTQVQLQKQIQVDDMRKDRQYKSYNTRQASWQRCKNMEPCGKWLCKICVSRVKSIQNVKQFFVKKYVVTF